jgi:hypothetical protein
MVLSDVIQPRSNDGQGGADDEEWIMILVALLQTGQQVAGFCMQWRYLLWGMWLGWS